MKPLFGGFSDGGVLRRWGNPMMMAGFFDGGNRRRAVV
jgi:hypothetical protein